MVRNPDEEEVEETRLEHAKFAARLAIAGHEQGAVRRIVMYTALGIIVLGLAASAGVPGMIAGGFALMLLMLLAMSDQLA